MIKLVAFDLDDTLYNEKEFVFGAFKEVAKHLSIKYNLCSESLYEDMVAVLKKYGRGKIFNIICKKYDIDEDIMALVQIYRNSKPRLNLYKDSIEILDKLKDKYKLGLITDGLASVQWNKIRSLNIEDNFDKIIVTDDLGKKYWKPNTLAFNIMKDSFKLSSKECIYIGDNPNKDFIGAKAAGYNTIRIIRKYGDYVHLRLDEEYEADYEVKSLKDIIPIIEKI
ncbi:MAG: HAD family hydrolase [Clostridium thermopalmarium]|uniref:HAD family hydrolase n=1 Tax=Clostridium thermopalmarium TaxID=29373 RepID=UPI00235622C8|nr:HAD-IA family hydrolase [Clostridium thermopalmarium]MBE6044711.1 HAD family hydrolase [Clostridium thermopalmarium]